MLRGQEKKAEKDADREEGRGMTPEELLSKVLKQAGKGISWDEALIQVIAPYLHEHIEQRYRRIEPTIYQGVTCEICGTKAKCLSILSGIKYHAHYISGNKMVCFRCLEDL